VHDIRKDMPGIVFGQNENTRYSQELVDAYKREILIRKEKAPRIKLAVCVEKITGKSPEKSGGTSTQLPPNQCLCKENQKPP
jgi:hypothetical protein